MAYGSTLVEPGDWRGSPVVGRAAPSGMAIGGPCSSGSPITSKGLFCSLARPFRPDLSEHLGETGDEFAPGRRAYRAELGRVESGRGAGVELRYPGSMEILGRLRGSVHRSGDCPAWPVWRRGARLHRLRSAAGRHANRHADHAAAAPPGDGRSCGRSGTISNGSSLLRAFVLWRPIALRA